MKKNIRALSVLAPLALAAATSAGATCLTSIPPMAASCTNYGPVQFYQMSKAFDGKTKAELMETAAQLAAFGVIDPIDPADVAFIPDGVELHNFAYIDGDQKCELNDEECELAIKKDFEAQFVYFNRTFTEGAFSTMTLPFELNTAEATGLAMVLKFNGITKNKTTGKMEVSMKRVWDPNKKAYKADVTLEAYKPYMVKMSGTSLGINMKNVTLKASPEADDIGDELSGWVFKGTTKGYQWVDDDASLKKDVNMRKYSYGFAAEAADGIEVGQFVKAGDGAWISPFRAFLFEQKEIGASGELQTVRSNVGKSVPTYKLPEVMDVVIEDDDEQQTTTIGRLNTRSGEFIKAETRVFDLKGRNVNGNAPRARGAYYGKKSVVR